MKNIFLFFGFMIMVSPIQSQSSKYEDNLDRLFAKGNEHLYYSKDSAYYYFNKIKDVATVEKDWQTVIDALLSLNMVADINSDLSMFQNNLVVLDSLYRTQKSYIDSLPGSILYKNLLLNEKGTYHYLLNDYPTSRKAFQKIIAVTEQLPDSLLTPDLKYYLSISYSYLAKMYAAENKFELAKEYYTKNIRYLNAENTLENQSILFNNYSLLAEVYKNEGKFEDANKYLLKTLEYNLKNKNEASVLTVLNIVQNHNSLRQKDSAVYYLRMAKDLMIPNDPELSSYYQVSAETYQNDGNYIRSEEEFIKALQLIQKEWAHKKHWEVAHVLNKIGLLQKQYGYLDKAIQNYDKAIAQLSEATSTMNQTTLLKILKNKAEALNGLQSDKAFALTISSVNRGIEILNSLKPSFKNQSDKLVLIEDAFPMLESGLEAAYNLYQSSKDKKYIELAFQYSEQSKAVLLMEALLGAKATEFANIPTELLEYENQLKSQITVVEKKIYKTKDINAVYEDELFDLRNEYRELVKKIETDYKAYFDLKYNNETISIEKAQRLLGDDELLMTYFYGRDAIYIISADANGQKLGRVLIDATLERDIKKIYVLLKDPSSDVSIFNALSFKLFTELISPFIKSNDKSNLIIIADGLLNYIPFAALNTRAVGVTYLAEKFSISYANSTTLLSQLRQKHPRDVKLLAFAPSFKDTEPANIYHSKLLPLPNNKKEVEQIFIYFHGRSFVGDAASLQNFKDALGNYSMVHLATHAIFDDASPENSYLAFASNRNVDNLLYVKDLYNLRTNADMVTLSACESGVGELRRGEGFLSLARGFFYSGASSICSTLWKINDASSNQLMDDFYKHLAEGAKKDVALQKAQIKFFNDNRQNALAHPYYWSGFVLSGNTGAVVQVHNWVWIVIGGIMLLLLSFIVLKRRKSIVKN